MPPLRDPTEDELTELSGSEGTTVSSFPSVPTMTEEEFTKERQRSATEDIRRNFPTLARVAINTLAAGTGVIPGIGTAAQAGIQAGMTTLSQLLGLEKPSKMNIAISAGIPYAAKGIVSGGKAAIKGAGELLNPGTVRRAGIEAVAQRAGATPRFIDRVFTTPESKAAFAALASEPPVSTGSLQNMVRNQIDGLTAMSNPSKRAISYLTNLEKKFQNNPSLSYDDVVGELQSLRQEAERFGRLKDFRTQAALYETRARALDTLDNISPKIKEVNRLYRREEATKDIINAARKGNPGHEIEKLMENDPLVRGAFPDKKELDEITEIAHSISDVASATPMGGFRQILSAATEPAAQMLATPTGRAMLRKTMLPGGRMTPTSLSAALQFWRAYKAQEAE